MVMMMMVIAIKLDGEETMNNDEINTEKKANIYNNTAATHFWGFCFMAYHLSFRLKPAVFFITNSFKSPNESFGFEFF